jgi:hypothetical protein
VDPSKVAAPKPSADLIPGTYQYAAKVELPNGQTVNMKMATTIKEENGAWTVVDSMTTPMGEVRDTVILEKGTLLLRKRETKQGPVTIQFQVAGDKATGAMNANGQEKPIAVDLGGPLFADAAGAPNAIASLPLAEGYTATFRNFDLQRQKAKLMQVKVTGTESVTVPAGTFDTYKVEISSAEGGPEKVEMWIAKDGRKPVKLATVLTQMGGAKLTSELVP